MERVCEGDVHQEKCIRRTCADLNRPKIDFGLRRNEIGIADSERSLLRKLGSGKRVVDRLNAPVIFSLGKVSNSPSPILIHISHSGNSTKSRVRIRQWA